MFVSVVLWDTWRFSNKSAIRRMFQLIHFLLFPLSCWILMWIYYTFPSKKLLVRVQTHQHNAKLLLGFLLVARGFCKLLSSCLMDQMHIDPKLDYRSDILVCPLLNWSPLFCLIAWKRNTALLHKLHDLCCHPGLWDKQCRTKCEQ